MDINIAENIKRLRRQKDYTQEELAQFIGISPQSVSKWERGEGYPDITLLPTIAAVFDVTLDELFGFCDRQNEKYMNELMEQYRINLSSGKIMEAIETLKEARKKFPDNFLIMLCYADSLNMKQGEDKSGDRLEVIELCKLVLDKCDETHMRNHAMRTLCYTYYYMDEYDKAIEIVYKMPSIYECFEITLPHIVKNSSESIVANKQLIRSLIDIIKGSLYKISYLKNTGESISGKSIFYNGDIESPQNDYTSEERIKLIDIAISLYNLIYEDGDYLYNSFHLCSLYEQKARLLFKNGEITKTLDALSEASYFIKQYDDVPPNACHTSLAVRGLPHNKSKTSNDGNRYLLDCLNKSEWDGLRQHERFIEIVKELENHAG